MAKLKHYHIEAQLFPHYDIVAENKAEAIEIMKETLVMQLQGSTFIKQHVIEPEIQYMECEGKAMKPYYS